MTSTPSPANIISARVQDDVALMANLRETVAPMQFMREIVFNGVQACQRTIAAGTKSGKVVVDYVDAPFAARKLRIWDTGDGMTREELFDRMGTISSTARSAVNFGVGSKLTLPKVSPHGTIYVSHRDGATYMTRMDVRGREWGPVVLNEDGQDEIAKTVVPAPEGLLPEEILAAGHGTVVILLGASQDDPTVWTLRPKGKESRRWVIETLNDRFTQFPKNVEVWAVMPDATTDPRTGLPKDDRRQVGGTADNLKVYTEDGKGSSDPTNGARGKVRINGPVPATAFWWVLPEGRKPSTFYRIGGNVRVVIDGEAYETHGVKYLTTAGVWNQTSRVEIHFVPDADAGARPDLQRSSLRFDGEPVPLLEWCEEFKKVMPTAIEKMLSGTAKARVESDFSDRLNELNRQLLAATIGRRSSRGSAEGVVTGTVSQFDPTRRTTTSGSSRNAGVRGLRRLLGRARTASSSSPTEGQVVHLGATTRGRRARAVIELPPMPQIAWVNENDTSDDSELGELAGRYVPSENLLVLNAQGMTYRRLVDMYTHWYRTVPGSKDEVQARVRESLQRALADIVTGAQRDFPDSWQDMLTPHALTVGGAGIYQINTRLRQYFGKIWKNVPQSAATLFDEEAA